jgi:hypothetical protein
VASEVTSRKVQPLLGSQDPTGGARVSAPQPRSSASGSFADLLAAKPAGDTGREKTTPSAKAAAPVPTPAKPATPSAPRLAAADTKPDAPAPRAADKPDLPAPKRLDKPDASDLRRADKPDAPAPRTADKTAAPARLDARDSGPAKAPAAKNAPDKPQADDAAAAAQSEDLAQRNALRNAMAPLRKAVEANRAMVDGAPALAFLAGKVERIDPAAIPTLVSDNGFFSDALGASDPASFVTQSMSVGDILEDLEVPEAVVDQAVAMGLDLSRLVSPQDILKALGLDPQRAVAELNLLRENLRSEGLGSYMRRAAAGTGAMFGVGAMAGLADRDRGEKTSAWSKTGTPLVTGAPIQPVTLQAPGVSTTVASAARTDGGVGNPTAGTRIPSNVAQPTAVPVSRPSAALDGASSQAAAPDASALAAPALAGGSGLMQSLAGAPLASAQAAAQAAAQGAPRLRQAGRDPFAALGEDLAKADVTRLSGDGLPSAAAPRPGELLEEALLRGGVTRQGFAQAGALTASAAALQNKATGPSLAELRLADAKLDAAGDDAAVDDALDAAAAARSPRPASMLAALTGTAADVRADAVTPGVRAPVALDDLRLSMPRAHADRGGTGSNAGDGDDGSRKDRGERSLAELTPSTASFGEATAHLHALGGKGSFGEALGSAHAAHAGAALRDEAAGFSPAQRAEMIQKIYDGATTMVRNGQKSVHLDLGSSDLGKLEVAVSMKDDRVDVRVLTASDRVRDAMAAELGSLRNALSVQSLQLGNVDVGVGQRQPGGFASSSGFTGGQQQQQSWQQAGSFGDDVMARSSAARRPSANALRGVEALRRVAGQAPVGATRTADGRIELRV